MHTVAAITALTAVTAITSLTAYYAYYYCLLPPLLPLLPFLYRTASTQPITESCYSHVHMTNTSFTVQIHDRNFWQYAV